MSVSFCLSSKVAPSYLKEAAEIKIPYKQRSKITKLTEKYDAGIVLTIPVANSDPSEINWDEMKATNLIAREKLYLTIPNCKYIPYCKEHNIKFMLGYAISNWFELNSILAQSPAYVRLAPPLTHDLEKVAARVKSTNSRIRAVPNVAYDKFFPREDGVTGSWIRPEDIEAYSQYIDIFEFEDCDDHEKEQTLYEIYSRGNWAGDLKMIITNLDYPGVNRMIPPDLSQRRINCKQQCEQNRTCRLCYRYLDLANPEKLEAYKKF